MRGIKIEKNNDIVDVFFSEDSVDFNVNDLNVGTLKTIEEGAISGILNHLQSQILNLPFIKVVLLKELDVVSLKELEENLIDCEYICDYEDNMIQVKNAIDRFVQFAEKGAKNELIEDFPLIIDDARNSYKEVASFINKILPVFTNARKVEQFGVDDTSKKRYLEVVTELNERIIRHMENADKYVKESTGYFFGNKEIYGKLTEIFKTLVKDMNIKYLKEEQSRGISKIKEPQIIKKSEAEVEREKYIEKANDLYMQLRLDWMRDLESQVPYLSRDKYQAFLNKFNKFNDTFEMPLVKTTSIGKAKEACDQINNLMNNISNISETAYTPFVVTEK